MNARRMTFYFDAASCSGCKACQIACMDRHDLGTDRPWRRVSEVAGGGWEQDGAAWRHTVFAYHLSISCNHCERPICLEGCPTKAITRRRDGVVLIEPDLCLGCGYCSWTCPYSAPRLHADRGVMTKCTFCADDLDAGLAPACVAACPVRALDAGDPTELTARHGSSDRAAGLAPLPAADLTEPALHLAPHADGERSREPGVALTPRPPRGLREWSLVVFTVLSQTAAGLALFAAGLRGLLGGVGEPTSFDPVLLPLVAGLLAAAMLVSTLHLGRPRNAARSFLNLRASWLSREIALAVVFLGAALLASWPAAPAWVAWLTVPLALAFLGGMARVYMQRTLPVWNRGRTPLVFAGAALLLGGLTANAIYWSLVGESGATVTAAASWAVLAATLVDQLRRRRDYFAGYERMGV